jgi:outer membrane protein assembly factor BamB/predicted MPP superfamily phosphohydrolase
VWLCRPDGWDASQWWSPPTPDLTFRLVPRDHAPPLRFAHLSDPHVLDLGGNPLDAVEAIARRGDGTDTELGLRSALSLAARSGAAFAVITGDLTDHGTSSQLRRVADCIATAPLPVHAVPGNHDHYGHRHQPEPADRPKGEGFLGSATVHRYEQVLGPRCWSMDRGGLHLLALDWFSAVAGIDADEQRRFIVGDLARIEPGTPILVLAHDQPGSEWFELIRAAAPASKLAGVLSGHWHAPKVVRDGDCLFVSTGPVSFGGLDWTAPQWRILCWDGTGLSVEVTERTTPPPAPPARQLAGRATVSVRPLGSGQHLGAVTRCRDQFLVPTVDGNATGMVVAVDRSGEQVWSHRLPDSPVTGLATDGDAVVAVGLTGTVHCLSAVDGTLRWRHQLPGRLRTRVLAAPVLTPARSVVVGDLHGVAHLDLASGRVRWERADLGPADTLLTYGAPISTPDTVVLPFGGPYQGLTALCLADGRVDWTDPPATPPPTSSVTSPGNGDDGFLVRDGPLVERVGLRGGSVRWRTAIPGRFTTTAPFDDGTELVVVTGDGVVHYLDADSGTILRRVVLTGLRAAHGPYRTTGTASTTSPVRIGSQLLHTLVDGSIWALPARNEPPRLSADLGAEVTTQPAAIGSTLAVIDSAGQLHLLTIRELLVPACSPSSSTAPEAEQRPGPGDGPYGREDDGEVGEVVAW